MRNEKYLFQKKKVSFTKQLFEKGLNTSALVLFALKESGEDFLKGLPSSYPGFESLKEIFGVNNKNKKFTKEKVLVNISRLEKQGLIRKESTKKIYFLTEKGKKLVGYIKDRYSILNKKWDGKIRIVIFDIPEKERYHREWLRDELSLLEFKELQKSVYAGKFPLPKDFYQDIIRFGISDCVFVFTVNDIDKRQRVIDFLEK